MKKEGIRYIIAGGINTAFTYLIYLILLDPIGYHLAFSVSFISGVLIAYFLNALFVFKSSFNLGKLLKYPFLYALQYFIGLILLTIEVELFKIDMRVAPFVNILILLPISFIMNKWFLKNSG